MAKYKNRKAKRHGDALWRLATLGEATVDIEDEIPCLLADCRNVTLEHQNKVQGNKMPQIVMLIAITTDTDPFDQLERIPLEELLAEQHTDASCQSLRSRLNGGMYFPFILTIKD